MPKVFTPPTARLLNAVVPADQLLCLLEIDHPDLPDPVRVVNDTNNYTGPGGFAYIGAPFRFTLPDESDRQSPRSKLQVDNVGRLLMDWVEASQGGSGATVRLMLVRAGAPTYIEDEYIFGMRNVTASSKVISADLGFENLLDVPAVAIRHDLAHSPGLF